MTNNPPKDILSRFADLSEEAMQKLADVPGANRLVEMTNQTRQRVDEVQRRMRGLDELERRVNELELRLATLELAQRPAELPSETAGIAAEADRPSSDTVASAAEQASDDEPPA
ncbi:MAG TPA: hypothetical protein VEY87_03650 [Gaiellaceae bacterium]|jgi:uncharacterized membrane protein YccC|nr:hypothetical protein [Gaiellaceae bacterium]